EAVVLLPREATGPNGFQIGIVRSDGVHRSVAGIRTTVYTDVAARPRLLRRPIGHFIGVVRFHAVVVAAAATERRAVAATRNLHDYIAVTRERLNLPITATG